MATKILASFATYPGLQTVVTNAYTRALDIRGAIICAMPSIPLTTASYGLIPIVLFLVFSNFRKTQVTKKPKDNTLQHLVSVLVPTRVSWEHHYSKLFDYTKSDKRAVIRLSLSNLLQNLYNGSLELRDQRDLQALISGRLRVSSGWTISLKIEFFWWLRLFYRLSFDKCYLGQCRAHATGVYMRSGSRSTQDFMGLLQRTGILTEPEDALSNILFYDLDLVCYSHLKSILYEVKRMQTKEKATVILEFTTLGLHISYLSSLYLVCAVPFLETQSGKRALTPLRLSLHHAIELLSDAAFEMRSVCDVSMMHAEELRRRSRHQTVRNRAKNGHKERLLLAWEAALLADGHLVRWRVCCTLR